MLFFLWLSCNQRCLCSPSYQEQVLYTGVFNTDRCTSTSKDTNNSYSMNSTSEEWNSNMVINMRVPHGNSSNLTRVLHETHLPWEELSDMYLWSELQFLSLRAIKVKHGFHFTVIPFLFCCDYIMNRSGKLCVVQLMTLMCFVSLLIAFSRLIVPAGRWDYVNLV